MKAEDNLNIDNEAHPSEQELAESETTDASEVIDMSQRQAPVEKKFIKSLSDFELVTKFKAQPGKTI